MKILERFLGTLFLTALAVACFAQKPGPNPGYLPIDSSVARAGVGPVGVWDLSAISQTSLLTHISSSNGVELTYTDQNFSYFSLDVALRLGINYVSVTGSQKYSVLFAEARRYEPVQVKISVDGATPVAAIALVGCACRVNMLSRDTALDLNLTQGAAGLGVRIGVIQESLAFSAIGFVNYSPFEITVDEEGKVDLVKVRQSMSKVFNDYVKAAGSLDTDVVPRILGFKVGPDFPDISKATSIKVTL